MLEISEFPNEMVITLASMSRVLVHLNLMFHGQEMDKGSHRVSLSVISVMNKHSLLDVRDVCTRSFYCKVTKIVEELCGKSVSKSFISSLTTQLDQQVEDFQ